MFGRSCAHFKPAASSITGLIVYVSDHGEMLGEHGYPLHKYCLYDTAYAFPLILAGTAIPTQSKGTVDHRPAELIDLFPRSPLWPVCPL